MKSPLGAPGVFAKQNGLYEVRIKYGDETRQLGYYRDWLEATSVCWTFRYNVMGQEPPAMPRRPAGPAIELTSPGGFVVGHTLVNRADADALGHHRWWRQSAGYAARNEGRKVILLHREILDAEPNYEVDHINGDRLDNRRSNLRIVTHAENMAYMRLRKSGRSESRRSRSEHPPTVTIME